MKIWFISDTHGRHRQLICPEGIDMVIHAGDVSTVRELSQNDAVVSDFLSWYSNLPIKHKIFIAGNHDTSIEAGMSRGYIPNGVIYLEHGSMTINGINIFGSPYTPTFGHGWAYNV